MSHSFLIFCASITQQTARRKTESSVELNRSFIMSSHKPGSLKQSNKKHKGTSGKRAQNRSFGEGRIASTSVKNVKITSNPTLEQKIWHDFTMSKSFLFFSNERQNRINRNSQLKKQKAAANWLQKRIGSRLLMVDKFC